MLDYINNNLKDFDGISYLKTTYEELSKQLNISESTVKRNLKALKERNEIIVVVKRGRNGGIVIMPTNKLDEIALANPTKRDKKLLENLFPITSAYIPTGARRTKEEMIAYNAEKQLMAHKLKEENKIFEDAWKTLKPYDYNETFAKIDNSEERYLVYLASRVYDAYAIHMDTYWYKQYNAWKNANDGSEQRGKGSRYHREGYRSLKTPFLGTRAYTYAEKLVNTAKEFKVTVPEYVWAVMSYFKYLDDKKGNHAITPTLAQITNENNVAHFKASIRYKENEWLANGHHYETPTLDDVNIAYALRAYNGYINEKYPSIIKSTPVFPQTDYGTAYGRYWDNAKLAIEELDIDEDTRWWANQYLDEQVSLAVGSMPKYHHVLSPIMNYLNNNDNGLIAEYRSWKAEDGGVTDNNIKEFSDAFGTDFRVKNLSREERWRVAEEDLDTAIEIKSMNHGYNIVDVYTLEFTRAHRPVRTSLTKLIKMLTPIMGLNRLGFIDREKIMEDYLY